MQPCPSWSACFCLQTHPDNPLLQVRGQAGTHDIDFARDTLEQLKSATSESSQVGLVRYDKSAHEGRGDRAPPSKWDQVKGKVDVVLFEGWMLGFKPLTDQAAEKVISRDLDTNHVICISFAGGRLQQSRNMSLLAICFLVKALAQ